MPALYTNEYRNDWHNTSRFIAYISDIDLCQKYNYKKFNTKVFCSVCGIDDLVFDDNFS